MIEFSDIHKRLGRAEILRGFSLRLEPGELALMLGPNGAGKTTALKIASGALIEDSGAILLKGTELAPNDRRRHVAYLPQGVAFQPRLSARQLLMFYARALGASEQGIGPALEQWGLTQHASKRSSALSGGLRQRLGLAVLSLADTPVLLLDEPGVSLDAEWREHLQEWLRTEARRGKSVLVATHLLREWEGRANRCLLCQEGRVAGEIDPARLRRDGLPQVGTADRETVS